MFPPSCFDLLTVFSLSNPNQFRESIKDLVVRRLRRTFVCSFILLLAGLPSLREPEAHRLAKPQAAVNGVFATDGTQCSPLPVRCKTSKLSFDCT